MKRILICILALMCLSASALAETVRLYDPDDVFTAGQQADFTQRADALSEAYGVDLLFVVTYDSQGLHGYDYAPQIYQSIRGSEAQRNYGVVAVLLDNRTYGFDARGTLSHAFNSNGGSEKLETLLEYHLRNDAYYEAANAYLDYVERLCLSDDFGAIPSAFDIANEFAVFVVIIAALIAGIVVAILVGKLKTARFASSAGAYVVEDSLHLNGSGDIFLYETVTRHKIQSQSSGGGRSGGGSRTRGGGSF